MEAALCRADVCLVDQCYPISHSGGTPGQSVGALPAYRLLGSLLGNAFSTDKRPYGLYGASSFNGSDTSPVPTRSRLSLGARRAWECWWYPCQHYYIGHTRISE